MKRNLLKFALCAMALLPMGAWADSEIVNVNYAKLATDNFAKGTTVNVTLSSTSEGKINSQNVYKFSYATSDEPPVTIISESQVVTYRSLYFRFRNNSTIGLYLGSSNQYGIINLQRDDIIEVATNDGTSGTGVSPANLVNATLDAGTGTQTYGHSFDDGGNQITLNYKIYTMTVSDDGLAGFELTGGAYVAYIKVTRPSNTACVVNTETYTVGGKNADESLPTGTEVTTGTWTNSNAFSFTLTGTNSASYVRDYNKSDVYNIQSTAPILLANNKIFNITKSSNIKSITLYATASSDSNGGVIKGDYNLTGETTLISELSARGSANAQSVDVTGYSNIHVSVGTLAVFVIEYYTSATLTVADINWASMYLPFAVNIPNGVTGVYYATEANSTSGVVTLAKRDTNLPKETGVVVNAPAGTYTFTAATTTPGALASENLFLGSATTKNLDDEKAYVLAGSDNEKATPVFKLYSSGKGTIDLSAYKAYLPASSVTSGIGSAPSILNFVIGFNNTTSLKEIETNNVVKNGEAYNLAGQRVSANTKGIVIINGRKYFNK